MVTDLTCGVTGGGELGLLATDPEVGSLPFTRVIGRGPTDREMARPRGARR